MTTFNAGAYLTSQMDSILAQLGADDELIVADDGSEDDTLMTITKYRDPRIRVFRNRFRHVTENFNFALQQARGDFVFLSDQDDEWYPQKVERMLIALERCDLVVSDCEVVDQSGALIAPSYFALNSSRLGLAANIWRNSYLGCCMGFRKRLLKSALPIPSNVPHDLWIGLITEIVGEPQLLAERLMRFRRHAGTASFAGGRSGRSLYAKTATRMAVIWELQARYFKSRTGEKT